MACDKIGHVHEWPTSGTLFVQRCEIKCNFCGDGKRFKYAWFLRRHIRAMHIEKGPYKSLTVSQDWDDAHAVGNKQKKHRQRRKKDARMAMPEYAIQPVYDQQLNQFYEPDADHQAALHVQATTGFGLDDILAREDGNYGFALGNEEPSSLMPADILETSNVDAWLDHLGAEAYDLPPLDGIDASGAQLFDLTNQAELNEPPPDLAPADSVSNIDGKADAIEDAWDDGEFPYLPALNTNPAIGSSSINDNGPKTPTPVFAQPDFFADATYHIDGLDFDVDLENPTKYLLADCTTTPDDNPLADTFKSTPVEDEKFQAMMAFLDTAAETMFQQGMDVAQMLSCVDTFSKGLKQEVPEKQSPHTKQAAQQKDTVDLTDDEFDQALKTLPVPTFSQILGEDFEV